MNNNWISVKERLPQHDQAVLAFAINKHGKAGYGVAIFIDSVKMNENLWKNGYGNEAVDVTKHSYYFASQEQKQHTYNVVTHWMELPEPPK